MKMYCNVTDHNVDYIVNNTFTTNGRNIMFTTNDMVLEIVNTAVFDVIKSNLAAGKTVRMPKNITELTPSDLIIDNGLSELTIAKMNARAKLDSIINKYAGSVHNMYFFDFSVLNNTLLTKGYYITDENKEEKYLEILQTADESLINLLQDYLESLAKISEYYALHKAYKQSILAIEDASDVQEVNNNREAFLTQFS